MTSKPPHSCWMMGGAQAWTMASASWRRLGATVGPRSRLGAARVMGSPTPIAFTLTRSWIQKWLKYRINLLISVFKVWEIGRFQTSMRSMALLGIQKPYEDQPASLQKWGHQRCHHIPKLVLGLNSVLLCWVPGLHPSPLCYSFSTRLPGELERSSGTDITLDMYSPYWLSTITMSRPWMLWIRSSFSYAWVKKRQYWTGCALVETPAGSHGVIPTTFSSGPHS